MTAQNVEDVAGAVRRIALHYQRSKTAHAAPVRLSSTQPALSR